MKRCRALGTDVFRTRVMMRRAVVAMGHEAAAEFYVPDRFTRVGAIPMTALLLLQDVGSAATLDGDDHRHRKGMLMSLMAPDRIQHLLRRMEAEWRAGMERWRAAGRVTLVPELWEVLCRGICAWAGVPLGDDEARRRSREFGAMFEGAGAVGPRNWRGMALRTRTERWIRGVVKGIRSGAIDAPAESAAHVISHHRGRDGEPLRRAHAAVEIINILRPTVAVERFITFAALALHKHPRAAERLRAGDDDGYLRAFVHEVRRFYPFFPMVGGRATTAFTWRGHEFAPGSWMLLDLYGTNHDPRLWDAAGEFRPERFLGREPSAFDLIPQGGGDHFAGHRCVGEWITVALMEQAVRMLTREMRYDVPAQDLRLRMRRMPSVPRSRFVVENVRPG